MMFIARHQLDHLESALRADFVRTTAEVLWLWGVSGPGMESLEKLRTIVASSVDVATRRGISRQRALAMYAYLFATFGPNFEATEPFAAPLRLAYQTGEHDAAVTLAFLTATARDTIAEVPTRHGAELLER